MREIKRIFIHCTAGSQKQTLNQLLQEFKAKGWKSPGYHYVIGPSGQLWNILPEDKVSNGVQGYNSTAINIAYIGGIDSKGRAVDNRTTPQREAMRQLLEELKKKYPNAQIMGHRDIWGKDPKNWKKQCPCFDAASEYKFLSSAGSEGTSIAEEEYKDIGKPKIQYKNCVTDYVSKYLDSVLDLRPWK